MGAAFFSSCSSCDRVSGETSSVSVIATINPWPVITEMHGEPNLIPAVLGSTRLSVTAEDANHDPLSFYWSSTCAGFFDRPTAADPTFVLTADATSCGFTVAVDDGEGGSNTGTLVLQVGQPAFVVNPCLGMADGTFCSDGDPCTSGESCSGGQCTGGIAVTCPEGQTCDPADGICKPIGPSCPAPVYARGFDVPSAVGISSDTQGNIFLAGALYDSADFGSGSLRSRGGADAIVAKLDPTTGLAIWAKSFGDSRDQIAIGSAISRAGYVGAIGRFSGSMIVGALSISNSGSKMDDFLIGLDGSGNGLWARKIDLSGGSLAGIAGHPVNGSFLVCGSALSAATDLVTGATYGGGKDLVVAEVDEATGNVLWGRQIGGDGDQSCTALAYNDQGNVLIVGSYNGLLDFGTSIGALPSPTSGSSLWIFAAELDGSDGSILAARSFGSGPGQQTPRAVSVDAAGDLIVAGSFTQTLAFGSTVLTSAGGSDAFVAKLDGVDLSARWARSWGGTEADEARGVGADSRGNVMVAGFFYKSARISDTITLTAAGAGSDAFVVKLGGEDGATVCGSGYGDEDNQQALAILVNRSALGPEKDTVEVTGTFAQSIDFGDPAGSLTTSGRSDIRSFLLKEK
jgi:hypothetical protein